MTTLTKTRLEQIIDKARFLSILRSHFCIVRCVYKNINTSIRMLNSQPSKHILQTVIKTLKDKLRRQAVSHNQRVAEPLRGKFIRNLNKSFFRQMAVLQSVGIFSRSITIKQNGDRPVWDIHRQQSQRNRFTHAARRMHKHDFMRLQYPISNRLITFRTNPFFRRIEFGRCRIKCLYR